ncbi:MAG TPA: hypothetical protein VEW46_00825, partial [Pyrinomonadaceae bacterium]|nr:hypothetical protein [Pyrinomonadaceae bacterium]
KGRAALTEDQRKDADKAAREAILSSETSTYAFTPGMSYVDKGFALGRSRFLDAETADGNETEAKEADAKTAPATGELGRQSTEEAD